jgi:hypothetical protein
MATIEDVQDDIDDLLLTLRAIGKHLENAECCEVKVDLCENLRSAAIDVGILKSELSKFIRRAERCSK